ncbi:MAG TPA: AAA family ATPase [Leptolyngbya sp.]|jgi:capsular exopolysaccharide synthesis family protein|nr:AAA family ATPase [Leptolyngbya sp.]
MENQTKSPLPSFEKNGKSPLPPDYVLQIDTAEDEEDSGKLFETLRRRIALIAGITAATTTVAWAITWNQPPSYESGFQLLVEPVSVQNQQDRDPLAAVSNTADNKKEGIDYETQIAVLLSPKLLQPIVAQIQQRYPDVSVESVINNLKIERPGETKLLQVTYKDEDPDRVKFILDKFAEGYLKYSQKERESNLSYGIAFVDRQIGETRQRVDGLQRQMQAFRQKNNFIAPDTLAGQVNSQVQAISQQKLQNDKDIAQAQRQYGSLSDRDGARAALAADGAYQSVLNKLRELDAKTATESTQFQGDSAEMRALRQQRDSLVPVLRQEAQRVLGNQLAKVGTDLSLLETQRQVLDRADAYWNGEVQRLPVLARVYTDLDRERSVATDSLTRLLGTRETLQIQAAQKDIPWQLITPPVRPDQPKDSPQRNLILGALIGLLLGIGAALLVDRSDHRIRQVSDLRKISKLPVLGVIPYDANPSQRGATARSLSPVDRSSADLTREVAFTESFRSLYTNLCLLNTDHPVRSLVISSATSGDGKTTVALHLAQAAAAMGQRVLLIDADLRSPQVAERLGLLDAPGLTELVTQNLNPQDVTQRLEAMATIGGRDEPTPEQTNFSILAAGKVPLDPTRILSSQKMQRLNDYFKAMYDLVIFDAPSLLSYADSSLLATHTNGMLVVAGIGSTEQADLRQMLNTLQTARVPVLGIAATRMSSASAN